MRFCGSGNPAWSRLAGADHVFRFQSIGIGPVRDMRYGSDFHGRAREESLVGAEKVFFGDGGDLRRMPEVTRDLQKTRPGDALEDGFGHQVGPNDAVLDDENIFSRALGYIALQIEENGLVIAPRLRLHGANGRLNIDPAQLGPHVELGMMDAPAGDDKGRDSLDGLLPEIIAPFPSAYDELDGAGFGEKPQVAVGVVHQGTDVGAFEPVFPHDRPDCVHDLGFAIWGIHPDHGR